MKHLTRLDSAQFPRPPNRPTASASDRLRRGALRGFVGWYWALVGDGVRVRGMPDADPLAAARTTKAVATLLREARSLLRRTDKLAHAADAVADPETVRLAAEARQAIEQLVHHVGYLEEQHKRQARDAARRGR